MAYYACVKIKKGDIVVFYFPLAFESTVTEYNITHLGRVIKTDNTLTGTIIRSKWGSGGIFETNLFTMPKGYGDRICFWRRK